VAQYLLQSLSTVKQWVRHYKDEGMESAEVAPRDMRFSGAMIIFETK
jgi:transposase